MGARSHRQLLTLFCLGFAFLCSAMCVSLQAPFYPAEAESKGATASEYGFVFGIFELIVFIISPVYGSYASIVGPKFMQNAGSFTTGITCILFGFLDRVQSHHAFIGLSFAVRSVEALGDAAVMTSVYTLVANEFPENVASTFSSVETCFGVGLIVGPTIGGALYEIGGYTLPFLVVGCCLLTTAFFSFLILPSGEPGIKLFSGTRMFSLLSIFPVFLAMLALMTASICIGFNQANLEPYLRPLELSPFKMGLMFIISGGTYAVVAPFWGCMCDKVLYPRTVTVTGAVLVGLAFSLMGHAPYLNYQITIPIAVTSLVFQGFGLAAIFVSTFTTALKDANDHGFPEGTETYSLIAGLYTSSFALGAFIGPSLGGVLFDAFGYPWASTFVVGINFLLAFLLALYILYEKWKKRFFIYHSTHPIFCKDNSEKVCLIPDNESLTSSSYSSSSKDLTLSTSSSPDRELVDHVFLETEKGD